MRTITELRAELERIRQHRRVAPSALARVLLGAEVALDWALDREAPSLLEHDGADLDFLVGEPDEELGRLIETVTATFPPPIEPMSPLEYLLVDWDLPRALADRLEVVTAPPVNKYGIGEPTKAP